MNSTGSTPCQINWAGLSVKPNSSCRVQRRQRPAGGHQIEGDFRRMHFQGELHAALGENIEDRVPPLGQ